MSAFNLPIAWDHLLARHLARFLARFHVHPNAVTTFCLLSGIGAAYLFSLGETVAANWAAALFMLAAFTDHVDGEVARATGKTSDFGHYYDHFAVGVGYVALFIGIGAGERFGPLGNAAILLGILAGFGVTLIFTIRLGIELRVGRGSISQPNFLGFEPEDTLYIVGPVTWLGGLKLFLIAAGIGAPVFLVWVLFDRYRKVHGGVDK